MILETSVDRLFGMHSSMIRMAFMLFFRLTGWVSVLRGGLHGSGGAWRRYNSLEWNNHSASLCLALHAHNRTLHPVQLRFPG